ncbi:MAG: SLBB domain-containing protein, partial [Aquificaceae bacterium]|nr:SLBB domain-containing protein [Aquificaceae bacterium]
PPPPEGLRRQRQIQRDELDLDERRLREEDITPKEPLKREEPMREKPSALEERINTLYKDILKGKELKQYGYEFFRTYAKPLAPVSEDYVLGPGDTLKVYLWGDAVEILSMDRELNVTISRDGTINLPQIGLINAAGLTIRNLKELLRTRYTQKFKNLKLDVTLTKLRVFNVYVTGFVEKPGMYAVDPMDTLISAIAKAGGVLKSGSLRNVEIRRKINNKLERVQVDLYDIFVKGLPTDVQLREGDVIHVPPIGDVVVVFGDIQRPGIYEIKTERELKDVLEFTGGLQPFASDMFIRLFRFSKDGVETFEGELSNQAFAKTNLKPGDLIFVGSKPDFFENLVELRGEVLYPGPYSIKDTKTLRDILIKAKPKVNATIVRVIREDKTQEDFYVEEVINNKVDAELKGRDTVIVYSKFFEEPIYLMGEVEFPRTAQFYEGITLMDLLKNVKLLDSVENLEAVIERKADKQYIIVYLYDMFVKNNTSLNLELRPGDTVIIRRVEDLRKGPSVTILGEVKNPGKYRITGGERLADVIEMVGGYTDRAYPRGLVFIRDAVRRAQKERIELTFTTIEEALAKGGQITPFGFASEEERQATLFAVQSQRRLFEILQKRADMFLGRVALEIPENLQELKKSPSNIVLQDGDIIIVPSKPEVVFMIGDYYNQISLPYMKGYRVRDYINLVGGIREKVSAKNVYVIKANGTIVSAETMRKGFLLRSDIENYQPEQGDAIVILPEFKVPTLWRPLLRDIVQIIFQSLSTLVLVQRL